jgi:hypothetical protein
LSKQCGDLSQDFISRASPINKIYSSGEDCEFNNNGNKFSSYSVETSYAETEIDAYTYNNNLVNRIRDWFPGNYYNSEELKRNSFKIYTRTYAPFSQEC